MFCLQFLSTLGWTSIEADDQYLKSITFLDNRTETVCSEPNDICEQTKLQLEEYFYSKRKTFELPLNPEGSSFQQSVWQQLLKIPYGQTTTYARIAGQLNNPLSVRAVGSANGQNPLAIVIPCHRVIGTSGALIGYAGGLWRKQKLLELEGFLQIQPSLF